MRRKRGKQFLTTGFAISLLLLVAVLYRAPSLPCDRGYTLYMDTSSSALQIQTDTPWRDCLLLPVKGESVALFGNRYAEIKESYRARLLFTEEVSGTTNYYLYSPILGATVCVRGNFVNLHIAVTETSTAVGTPLIFGGY